MSKVNFKVTKKSRWFVIEDKGRSIDEAITILQNRGVEVVRKSGNVHIRFPAYHSTEGHSAMNLSRKTKRVRVNVDRNNEQINVKQYCAVVLKND